MPNSQRSGQLATRAEVVIDNQLLALSELASAAFIAKKEFTFEVETHLSPNPEPSTFLLVLSGAGLFAAVRRRNAF
jgi:hypothetical protein